MFSWKCNAEAPAGLLQVCWRCNALARYRSAGGVTEEPRRAVCYKCNGGAAAGAIQVWRRCNGGGRPLHLQGLVFPKLVTGRALVVSEFVTDRRRCVTKTCNGQSLGEMLPRHSPA